MHPLTPAQQRLIDLCPQHELELDQFACTCPALTVFDLNELLVVARLLSNALQASLGREFAPGGRFSGVASSETVEYGVWPPVESGGVEPDRRWSGVLEPQPFPQSITDETNRQLLREAEWDEATMRAYRRKHTMTFKAEDVPSNVLRILFGRSVRLPDPPFSAAQWRVHPDTG